MGYLSASNIEKRIIKSVYNPRIVSSFKNNFILFPHESTFYYAYCRHALKNALLILNIKAGDTVLLPAFICKDILSSIHSMSAIPSFYHVNESLEMLEEPENLPNAKAIIAVNFFGFPQNLDKFKKYCSLSNAYLIEDNAHGFLSKDSKNEFLGKRGDVGLYSIRKTLAIPNGAALLINSNKIKINPDIVNKINENTQTNNFKFKNMLRKFVNYSGIWHIIFLLFIIRTLRKFKTGDIYPKSSAQDEYNLPNEKKAHHLLFYYLKHLIEDEEIKRRRELYSFVEKILIGCPCNPVFPFLPENTAPYLYPFYAEAKDIKFIRKVLSGYHLECFPWPDLPSEIENNCPKYYKNVWGVRFLW
ncbi:DegT/DnrJ/EryC1/StrS family aminotransferase [Silvanigrella aquatica]|uniref:DegT/DnrJ/EryC1/StrS aminotransferase n=1 Tax=Silvanigrella aquatica TaxID=1915309 RepID=A0A1L4D331_9BACT|nr:DegT/DnrJ/EryC1/StrS family aminotransferase [Silvanigrella aquatica]APJ04597.1 hypothetical protein AXG55_12045 [Silvanigrella aquatica]